MKEEADMQRSKREVGEDQKGMWESSEEKVGGVEGRWLRSRCER